MANRTRFAGLYNAIDFWYGGSGKSLPPPLVVDIGAAATGVGTLALVSGQTMLTDGTVLFPLATTCPITVGSDSAADSVTPSAVGNATSTIYDAATVTANFSHLHGQGDPISSATFGLQEALNYASAAGGGQVIIDAAWAAAAGTSAAAIIAAATVPSGTSIWDNRSGAGGSAIIQQVTKSVSNAQLLLLNTNGVEIIAAPPAGTLIDVLDMVVELVFVVAAFTGGSTVFLNYGTGTSAPCSSTIATTFFTSFSATQVIKVAGTLAVLTSANSVGKSVRLTATSTEYANATSGLSTANVTVNYRSFSGL